MPTTVYISTPSPFPPYFHSQEKGADSAGIHISEQSDSSE